VETDHEDRDRGRFRVIAPVLRSDRAGRGQQFQWKRLGLDIKHAIDQRRFSIAQLVTVDRRRSSIAQPAAIDLGP
jgi:hypothetical protein